jgi:hypothetical protein
MFWAVEIEHFHREKTKISRNAKQNIFHSHMGHDYATLGRDESIS